MITCMDQQKYRFRIVNTRKKEWKKKAPGTYGMESREGTVELIVPREIAESLQLKPGDKLLMATDGIGAVFYRVDMNTLYDCQKIQGLRAFMHEIKSGRKPKARPDVGTLPGMDGGEAAA
jgi:hypothetical protein